VILRGGYTNDGQVVRVGETVRRPWRKTSPATGALLVHLERVGFDGAPRFLGRDEDGRETLSYVDGEAAIEPQQPWALTDEALVSVARLLRAFHDAVASFEWDLPKVQQLHRALSDEMKKESLAVTNFEPAVA